MTLAKVGIIGLGHIGAYHVGALGRTPEIQLVAACDRNQGLRGLLPSTLPFCTTHQDLLARDDLDTVIIATPNETHVDLAHDAFRAGKNVIMEKPAATSMAGFASIEDLFASAPELHVYYAFHAAKAFDVTWAREYLADAEVAERLGPITSFCCQFHDPYVQNDILATAARGLGDSWVDSGVNALSVLGELLDLALLTPLETVATRMAGGGPIVQAVARYGFAPGRKGTGAGGLGMISTSWTQGVNYKSTTLEFANAGRAIVLDHTRQAVVEVAAAEARFVLRSWGGGEPRLLNHYLGVFEDYVACRRAGRFNGDVARAVHDLLFRSASPGNRSTW